MQRTSTSYSVTKRAVEIFHALQSQYFATPFSLLSTERTVLQGRLIPGSSVASVPFLDTLRAKAAAAAGRQDSIPDECFTRLRGALFLGPLWTVTRNKLKLRCAAELSPVHVYACRV